MDEIDTNAKLDDERLFHKSDMLIVMVHELIMPRKKHSNGKPYVNLPKGIKKLLANATNNVTKDWKDKNEDERMNWWNMKYGNLRHTMGFPGLFGGGELAERRLNAAREHFESNGQESVKIGLELLQKLHRQETHQLLIEMGLSLDDWIPHINEHGEEPLDGSNMMSEPTEDPLLDRLASEELDSLERKILDEMRKASKRLGGPFSKTRSDGGNNDDMLKNLVRNTWNWKKAISFKNMCNPSYRMKPRMFSYSVSSRIFDVRFCRSNQAKTKFNR